MNGYIHRCGPDSPLIVPDVDDLEIAGNTVKLGKKGPAGAAPHTNVKATVVVGPGTVVYLGNAPLEVAH